MTDFHDVSFPLAIGRAARGGPERRTEVVTLRSGREERNAVWANSRRRWDAAPGVRTRADIETLMAFFEARNGQLHAFRFLDPFDHDSARSGAPVSYLDQLLGVGDGTTRRFQLMKHYGDVAALWQRVITHPVADTVQIAVEGQLVSGRVETGGWVELDEPPADGASLTAGYRFETPTRFDTDHLEWALEGHAGQVVSVPLIEVLL